MHVRTLASRILLAAAAFSASEIRAATYTWANPVANNSLIGSGGYVITTGSYWVGGSAPVFDNQTELVFTGMGADGSSTVYGGNTTRILNRLTVSTSALLRFNAATTILSFQGTAPTIDVQSGTFRLEVRIINSAGLTKTGAGTMFSNLQSASLGFTGAFTIEGGMLTSGNNFALGDEKTVNVRSGATVNMNGQLWSSSVASSGTLVSRNYTFNIAGSGLNGAGAIANLSASAVNVLTGISGIRYLNLDADAAVGGAGNFNIGHGGTVNGNGHTLTKTGTNTIYLSGTASNIAFAVNQGRLVGYNTDSALGSAGTAVSVASGATLGSDGLRTFANSLTLEDGATLENLSSSLATWTGSMALSSGIANFLGSSSGQMTLGGALSGAGGIQKQGANTLLLSGANTYTGETRVTAGTLRLGSGASIANSSAIVISSGATLNVADVSGGYTVGSAQTLSGGGTVTGNTVISGTHAPGFSPGLQTFTNNLTYSNGSDIVWELAANSLTGRGTSFDGIDVQGNLTFQGAVALNLSFSYVPGAVDWTSAFWDTAVEGLAGWKIFGVTGTVNGFANLQIANASWLDTNGVALASARPGAGFSLYQGADGIYLNYTPVPEPSTYGLMLGGLALAGAAIRRRKTSR